MSWIEVSIIFFLASVVMYLFIRKNQLLGIPNIYNNLAVFLVPTILLVPIIFLTHQSFVLSQREYFLILLAGVFFSYLGSFFSLLGIEKAANPGYSLIIQKSYVVMTSILAIFLFRQSLTFKDAIAIVCIVLFSGLIVVNKTKSLFEKSYINFK